MKSKIELLEAAQKCLEPRSHHYGFSTKFFCEDSWTLVYSAIALTSKPFSRPMKVNLVKTFRHSRMRSNFKQKRSNTPGHLIKNVKILVATLSFQAQGE